MLLLFAKKHKLLLIFIKRLKLLKLIKKITKNSTKTHWEKNTNNRNHDCIANYLRGKLSFSLYRTILYWEIAMARIAMAGIAMAGIAIAEIAITENCLSGRASKKKRTYVRYNYNNSFYFFLSYCSR